MNNPKVLVVGHGYIGKRHVKVLQELQKKSSISHIAVADEDQDTLSGLEESIKTFGSIDDGLNDFRPDIVCIASNTAVRTHMYKSLIKYSGSPSIFVEKPVADSNDDMNHLRSQLELLSSQALIVAFGYLIRSSQVVDAAIEKLNGQEITNIEITWQKKRGNTRPTPGVHIDEATHAIDTVRYVLQQLGIYEKPSLVYTQPIYASRANLLHDPHPDFFSKEAQTAFYGPNSDPMGEVSYRFDIGGINVRGISSFMRGPQKRTIAFQTANSALEIFFDEGGRDYIIGFDYKETDYSSNKILEEWVTFLDYHTTGVKPARLAGITDALIDHSLVKMLEQ